jgi:hypothetical protein
MLFLKYGQMYCITFLPQMKEKKGGGGIVYLLQFYRFEVKCVSDMP